MRKDGIDWVQYSLKWVNSEKSEEVYQILLEQTTNESEQADIYVHLGLAKR